MVYLALLNVVLIGFDLTYTWLRPWYLRHLPAITDFFDPYKGIEPQPVTDRYLLLALEVEQLLAAEAPPRELLAALQPLKELSANMLERNPFAETEHPQALQMILQRMARALGPEVTPWPPAGRSDELNIFRAFWANDEGLTRRVEVFRQEIGPTLVANYARKWNVERGKAVDRVWLLDLPFLLIFALEFLVRWGRALLRGTYRHWYVFPLIYWYDLLGLIPYFRIFRLFRLVSIYVRLHQSERTNIGQGAFSRLGKRLSSILAEEVSDKVAIRILGEVQREIRSGTHREIILETLAPRRAEIRGRIATEIHHLIANEELQARGRALLKVNLGAVFEQSKALQKLPFSESLLRPVVVAVGDAVVATLIQTLSANLETDEGRQSLEEAGDALVDALFANLDEKELIALVEEVVLDVLERTKQGVAVKKWAGATPD